MTHNQRWKQTAFGRMIVYLGSVRFAVPVLTFVAFAMIWGTYIDSTRGAVAAGDAVYGSWWFVGLMALICVSLILSVVTRWPWRTKHIGFIVVHASLVALIASAFVSYFLKIEGKMILREGQTSSQILTNSWRIALLDNNAGSWSVLDSATVDSSPMLTIGDERLRIVEFWPNSADHLEVTDTGPSPLHAVRLGFTPDKAVADWIGELRPGEPAPVLHGIEVRVLRAGQQWESPDDDQDTPQRARLIIERIEDHPRALVITPDGSTTAQELHNTGPWRIPIGGTIVTLFDDYANASASVVKVRASEGDSNAPAVVIDWVTTNASRRVVLAMGVPTAIRTRDGDRFLQYEPIPYSLSFAITLEDFRAMDYPGSTMAMAYESDVVLHVEDSREPVKIWMNNPLEHDGWRLYQSGFVGDSMSILQATRDPGLTPMYISCFTLCIGITLTFFIGPLGGGHPGIPAPFTEGARKAERDDPQRKTSTNLHLDPVPGGDAGDNPEGVRVSPARVDTGVRRHPGLAQRSDDADRHARTEDGGRTHGPHEVVG